MPDAFTALLRGQSIPPSVVSQVARISYLGCEKTGDKLTMTSNKVIKNVRIYFNFRAKIRSNQLIRYFAPTKQK